VGKRLVVAFCLAVLSFSPALGEEVLLTKAVEKLILEVHQLKLRVAKLEEEVAKLRGRKREEKKEKRTEKRKVVPAPKKEKKLRKVTVLRGEFEESSTSCLLATVKRVTEKGKRDLLSLLPPDVPVYTRKWGRFYVYLTLPKYCEVVKERIKDAQVVHIRIE